MNGRARSLLFGGAVLVIVSALFITVLGIRRPLLRGPTGDVLADPDSYQRYALVRRALAGEGVRIRWIDTDNAPHGRINEWTSPVTALVVAGARLLEITGRETHHALATVCLWYGPLMGVAQLAVWFWLGQRISGSPLGLGWMLAWVPLLPVMRTTAFGCIDHHSLHQLAAVLMVAGPLAWQRQPTWLGGTVTGAAAAVGLWSGASEVLPFWWLVAALAVWELWPRVSDRESPDATALSRYWQGWWVSGAVFTTAAWLWEFWPQPFHGHLEFLSAWHVVLWLVAGALLHYIHGRRPARGKTVRAVGIAFFFALVTAGALCGFQWDQLHVVQDERFAAQAAAIHEFQSWLGLGWWAGLGRLWRGYGLLPLVALLGLVLWRQLSRRERWVWAVLAGLTVLTLDQLRWESFFVIPLVAAAGVVACALSHVHPAWLPTLLVVATLPAWGTVAIVSKQSQLLHANPMTGPHATKFALTAVSECLGKHDPGAVVLAGWDHGAILGGLGQVRVLGSAYWSNLDGLFAGHELLTTTDPDRFRALARAREVRWLLVPGPARFASDIEQAFLVLHGRLPSAEEVHQTVAWQLASDSHRPRLPCERLQEIAPDWTLLQITPP